tara:strand:- start:308 stop:613 length:306 start_codon:yes stop_codon:yes gene_type:complete
LINLAFFIYFILCFFSAYLVRKVLTISPIKQIAYAFFLSFFISAWFSTPGSNNIAPIFSIFFMEIIGQENINFDRLMRPFFTIFFIILFFDTLFSYLKKKA